MLGNEYETTLPFTPFVTLFTVRRYASAGVSCRRVHLSVCLSVTRRYCIETAVWIKLIFLRAGFPRPINCDLKKLVYLQKRILHAGTLFLTLDLENLATAFRPSDECGI